MTSEQKVKQLWPKATLSKEGNLFKVTITRGRYAYGKMKRWAWKHAWESIIQDEELSVGDEDGKE